MSESEVGVEVLGPVGYIESTGEATEHPHSEAEVLSDMGVNSREEAVEVLQERAAMCERAGWDTQATKAKRCLQALGADVENPGVEVNTASVLQQAGVDPTDPEDVKARLTAAYERKANFEEAGWEKCAEKAQAEIEVLSAALRGKTQAEIDATHGAADLFE